MGNQYGINVITIALIYNYLANNNYSLDMETINKFLEYIKEKMIKNYQMFDIDLSIRNSDIFLNAFFITGGMRNNKILMLNLGNNLEDIYSHYSNYIPSELITETLNEEALQIIGVTKDKLKICNDSKTEIKTEEIYEKDLESAKNFIMKQKINHGANDIKIINSYSNRKDNNMVHYIKVSYTRTREFLDKSMFNENQKTKKKTYTSYYRF